MYNYTYLWAYQILMIAILTKWLPFYKKNEFYFATAAVRGRYRGGYKQRSQLQEQQTHFFEHLTSHAPEEHTKSQRLPCTYSNGVPMTSTAPPIQKMMSTLEASKTGAVRENRVIRSFSTGQQYWHWICPL